MAGWGTVASGAAEGRRPVYIRDGSAVVLAAPSLIVLKRQADAEVQAEVDLKAEAAG